MGLWDKVQDELGRAGRAAQDAIDEGRMRLEIFRVRQLADKSAQALGYAYYRARSKAEELDAAAWERLSATLRDHEAEASRLEAELAKLREPYAPEGAAAPAEAPAPAEAAAPAEPPAAPTV